MVERKNILVVDDDEQILIVWRGALARYAEQWHVETVQSGQEALEKIKATRFDLVVTDLKMPGMSGCDLTVAIRQLIGDVPVIWITGYPQFEALAKADELGVSRFLSKPLSVAQIRQLVAWALEDGTPAADPLTREPFQSPPSSN
jgi:CheY-like chemotaxis protein